MIVEGVCYLAARRTRPHVQRDDHRLRWSEADYRTLSLRQLITGGLIDPPFVSAPPPPPPAVVTLGARRQAASLAALPAGQRPAPSVRDYDQLLTQRGGATGAGQGRERSS
jgi:hypothetical protein